MSALEATKITLGMFDSSDIPSLLRVWGGEGERDSDEQDDDDVDENDDDDVDEVDDDSSDEDEDDDDDDDEDDKSKSKSKKKKTPSLEEQLDEERRKNIKLQREIEKGKTKKDEEESNKNAAKDRDKYKARLESRDKFLTENLLALEIRKQTKYEFVDVDDVVSLIQRRYGDEVIIDLDADTPSVEGLDLALKRIAKDKKHWLKPVKDENDDEEEQPSGGRFRGNKRQESQEAEDKALAEKYKFGGFGSQAQKFM